MVIFLTKKAYPNKKGDAQVVQGILAGEGLSNLGHDSDGMIFFTSGTTSMPKAVLSTQLAGLHNVVSSGYSKWHQFIPVVS